MKLKTIYVCKDCNFQASKWQGQCENCKKWNTLYEDVINVGKKDKTLSKTPRQLKQVVNLNTEKSVLTRIKTGIEEFDRVIGAGITPGSLSLLSGEPGIGKSTLTLQIAYKIAKDNKVLIISGEESIEQIANRAQRLKLESENLMAINEFNLENIINIIENQKPSFVIIDSIQVISSMEIESTAGSVSQVRYCTEKIMETIKNHKIATLLIGHVTKDGNLAGPRSLEHLVDTVLQLDGDRYHQLRTLRSAKNRFGSCDEVGIFEMTEDGMLEVPNPSAKFLADRDPNALGSTLTITMEGTRPFVIEVQALVSPSHFGYPKRSANGFDLNRLQMLIAVIEKYAKINLQNQDIYINIVGGLRLKEPGADLSIIMAIASSFLKKPLGHDLICWGEIGLSGEIRQIIQAEKRQKEAKKLGFTNIISPDKHKRISDAIAKIS